MTFFVVEKRKTTEGTKGRKGLGIGASSFATLL
jgi:hypothetical protein